MPYAEGTLTDQDVAAFLKIPVDAELTIATDAARAWGQRVVSRIPPEQLWSDADRHRGGVLEGAFQYLRRAAPGGMPAYANGAPMDTWTLHLDAVRLIRPDVVVG